MNRIRIHILIGFLTIAWACGMGAADAPSEPGVTRDTLANGLKVIVVQNPLAPVVTTVINYRVGSDEVPADFPGIAHAMEHMMFRGSPGLSADQLAEVTAALGGDFDADTQQAVTQYFFTAPSEDLEVRVGSGGFFSMYLRIRFSPAFGGSFVGNFIVRLLRFDGHGLREKVRDEA